MLCLVPGNMYQVLQETGERKGQFLGGAKDRMEELGKFSIINILGVCRRSEEDILRRGKNKQAYRYEDAQGGRRIMSTQRGRGKGSSRYKARF